jgi:ELWxxDGT repeat protein
MAAWFGWMLWNGPAPAPLAEAETVSPMAGAPSREAPSPADLAVPASLAETEADGAEAARDRAFRQFQRLAAKEQGLPVDKLFDPVEFRIAASGGGGYEAENPAQEFGARFQPDGSVAVENRRTGSWRWSMRTRAADDAAWERVSASRLQRPVSPGVVEWYLNEARGLEQGFTVLSPEADRGRIELAVATDLEAELVDRGSPRERIAFRDASGAEALSYHGLVVVDASGRVLPSRLETERRGGPEAHIALVYDAAGADYPVTVDPWVSTELAGFPGSRGSYPCNFTEFKGEVYFRANDGSSGDELWKTNGTRAGTVMVKDINPGCESSSPDYLAVAGDLLFFRARTVEFGYELWVTDGTSGGTRMVKDIRPGTSGDGRGLDSYPESIVALGNQVVFSASDTNDNTEPWVSDGTAEGTYQIKDIQEGDQGSYPYNLVSAGNLVFFGARSSSNDAELWKTDGTEAGTVRVKDIVPGTQGSWPESLVVIDGILYFSAASQHHSNWDYRDRELWRSDGTDEGTYQITDIAPGSGSSDPYYMTSYKGEVYFRARDYSWNYELWKSNGQPGGYSRVKDIRPGSTGSYPQNLRVVGETLVFMADDGTHGYELWASDGSEAGTSLLKDINPGPNGSSGWSMVAGGGGGVLYFTANDGDMAHGYELWRTDGTEQGTRMVRDIAPGLNENGYARSSYPECLAAVGGRLYFNARATGDDSELWTSDGTEAGTVLVKDINRSPFYSGGDGGAMEQNGGYGMNMVISGGLVYFVADDGIHGWELWATDGSPAGTRLVRDIYAGGFSAYPRDLTDLGGTLLFSASDGGSSSSRSAPEEGEAIETFGRELWRSDGTRAGTRLVKDLQPGSASSSPYNLTVSNGILFFSAEVRAVPVSEPEGESVEETYAEGDYGRELWRSDGTEAGTILVRDIRPGGGGSDPYELTDVGGTLYFTANDGSTDYELWKSDGTEAGTVLVKDIRPGGGSWPSNLTGVGATLYFNAYDGVHGHELWKSDGTEVGTVLVKDINPGSNSSNPDQITAWGGQVYFNAYDDIHGRELWKSDGTEAGTVLVKDIFPGVHSEHGYPLSSSPQQLTPVGGSLFFIAEDGVHGRELWKTDGTEAGTTLVRDILPGRSGSCVYNLTAWGDVLVFTANDGMRGTEAWTSDGTTAGTRIAEDLLPGIAGSSPVGFLPYKGGLLYWAGTEAGTSLRSTLAPVAPTVVYRPDLLLRRAGGRWIGDDLYRLRSSGGSVPGQTLSKRMKAGERSVFGLRIENDGNRNDRIRAGATGLRSGRLRVVCLELGEDGASPVTAALLGGRYVRPYPAGGSRTLRIEVTNVSGRALRPASVNGLFTVRSLGDPRRRDLGAIRLTLESAPKETPPPPMGVRK